MANLFGPANLPMIACIALLAGAVLQILGFAAPYWAHDGIHNVGLWRKTDCMGTNHKKCYQLDHVEELTPTWLCVVRGLESLGIIFMVIPLIILPIYMYIALGMYYKCMMVSMCISSFLSAICIIIGVAIYAYNVSANDWNISWCAFVCIVACAFTFIAFLVLCVTTCSKRPPSLKEVAVPSTIYVDENKPQLYMVASYE